MTDRSNLYIYQSTDYRIPLEFSDAEGPIDLTEYEFFADIRKIYSSTKVAEFSFFISEPEAGKIEMYIQNSVTKTLPEGKYQYDVLARHPTNDVLKILEGLVFIMPSITKIEE